MARTQWEYLHLVTIDSEWYEDGVSRVGRHTGSLFNELGSYGWELVSASEQEAFFNRPVEVADEQA